MYKRVTKQCNNDVKKRFNCIAKGRKKTNRDIIKRAKKKWVNGKPETKEWGRRRRFKNRLKKEWVTKLVKKINKIQI